MPAAKNYGNAGGLPFDRFCHPDGSANHGAREYGNSEAQSIAQFTKNHVQPIWLDCRIDDNDLEAGSEQRGGKTQ
jgi:hypothetical protein